MFPGVANLWRFLVCERLKIYDSAVDKNATKIKHYLRTVPTNSKIFLPRFMIMQEM